MAIELRGMEDKTMGETKPKLNPMNREDKMCRSKRQYSCVEEARQAVAARDPKLPLYLYACPYGAHFHLTKHPKPLDPELKDRVNTPLMPIEQISGSIKDFTGGLPLKQYLETLDDE
jgi:hypothetical protein